MSTRTRIDNWRVNLWQLMEILKSFFMNCQRLTCRLSKITRFSSLCSWLVLLSYFVSIVTNFPFVFNIDPTSTTAVQVPQVGFKGNYGLCAIDSKTKIKHFYITYAVYVKVMFSVLSVCLFGKVPMRPDNYIMGKVNMGSPRSVQTTTWKSPHPYPFSPDLFKLVHFGTPPPPHLLGNGRLSFNWKGFLF